MRDRARWLIVSCAGCGSTIHGYTLIGLKHYCDDCAGDVDYDDAERERHADREGQLNDLAEGKRHR